MGTLESSEIQAKTQNRETKVAQSINLSTFNGDLNPQLLLDLLVVLGPNREGKSWSGPNGYRESKPPWTRELSADRGCEAATLCRLQVQKSGRSTNGHPCVGKLF